MTPTSTGGSIPVPRWATALARIAIVILVLAAGYVTAIDRPDLVHPTVSGDAANYEAGGERLNLGHNLYGPLLPGDRPIPGYPQDYPAPLLSPPLVAVIWRPLALFGDAAIELWWFLALALMGGIVVAFATVGRWLSLGGLFALVALGWLLAFMTIRHPDIGAQSPISFAALSGNLNAYILGLCILVWLATSYGRPSVAGVAAALAAVLKLGPFALAWWLFVRRDWPALKAFVATVAILGVVGLLGAGLSSNLTFLRLGLSSNIKPTGLSVPGMLEAWIHVNPRHAGYGTIVATIGGLAVVFVTRRRPRLSYFVTLLVIVYSSPVVLAGNFVLLLAAATPSRLPGGSPSVGRPVRRDGSADESPETNPRLPGGTREPLVRVMPGHQGRGDAAMSA